MCCTSCGQTFLYSSDELGLSQSETMYSSAHNHRALLNVHLWKKEEIHEIGVKISMGNFLYVCNEINVTDFYFF